MTREEFEALPVEILMDAEKPLPYGYIDMTCMEDAEKGLRRGVKGYVGSFVD